MIQKRRDTLTRYPWNDWFNRKRFVITRGADFDCMTHSMVAQVRSRAAKLKKRGSVLVENNNGTETITVIQQA